jgi:hypothetical protein
MQPNPQARFESAFGKVLVADNNTRYAVFNGLWETLGIVWSRIRAGRGARTSPPPTETQSTTPRHVLVGTTPLLRLCEPQHGAMGKPIGEKEPGVCAYPLQKGVNESLVIGTR